MSARVRHGWALLGFLCWGGLSYAVKREGDLFWSGVCAAISITTALLQITLIWIDMQIQKEKP